MSVGIPPTNAGFVVTIVGVGAAAVDVRKMILGSGVAGAITVRESVPHSAVEAACDVLVHAVADAAAADALARLRRDAPDLALVALTGRDDAALRGQLLAGGVHECLALPDLRADVLGYALRCAVLQVRGERERRGHAAELRALFDLGAHPMWICEPGSLRLLAANRAAVEAYGYSEAEVRALSLADLRWRSLDIEGEDDLPRAGTTRLERHRRKDGSAIEVELFTQVLPLRGRRARILQARDVTDERRAVRALEASERRFRDFFEHSTGYICIHDLDGTLLSVNPAAATALGRSTGELLGMPLRELAAPHLRFLVDMYLHRIARSGEDDGYLRVRGRDGADLVWQYHNRLYTDADGSSYVMGYAQDITAMRAAERAFRLSERRLRTIADTLPLMIAYFDAQQRVVFANGAWQRTFAPDGTSAIGRPLREVLGEERYTQRQPHLENAFAGQRVMFEVEQGEGDDWHCLEITFIPEFSESGDEVIGVHAMLQDVTAKKREERRLTRLARVDPLTGLLNRAGFYDRLDNALARSRDQDALLALFYLDVDRFKPVNDSHGHAAGDALLRAFAARLAGAVRSSDVVARLGGDEFTVVMEGVPDTAWLERTAAMLVATMRRPFELRDEGLSLVLGTSIGIAVGRAVTLPAASFVARADAMLYAAKQAGRGAYRLALVEPEPAQPDPR
jgi:diguanylate cyclase (GGDEF)-like protein/PAS domain S-box-containing protein